MTARYRLMGLAIALVSISVVAPAAQVPVRDAQPKDPAAAATPTGTGSISGMVTTQTASPAALRMVSVVLVGSQTGVMRMTMTDDQGRFAFQRLPVDRYAIAASRPPYLAMNAGARRPGQPGTPIALSVGQAVTDVMVRLPLGAAIGGTILDDKGRPASGVGIGIQPVRMEGGVRRIASPIGQLTITDQFGRYRIYGLAPGSYVVVAMSLIGSRFDHPVLTDAQVDAVLRGEPPAPHPSLSGVPAALISPVPVYFPGTTRMTDAQILTLATGDDRRQTDFQIQWGRTARVEGSVSTSDGRSASGVRVSLTNEAGSALQTMRTAITADGRFSILLVPPGRYTLEVRISGTPALVATSTVDVDGVDQVGHHLTLQPALTIGGRVVMEGSTAVGALLRRSIGLQNLADGARVQSQPIDAKGTLSIPDVLPGRYLVRPPQTFGPGAAGLTLALQSVVADGVDVTDLPLTVTQDAPPKELVVTFGERWQELSGRLIDSAANGVSDYTVMVFPVNEAYWLYGSRRIVVAQPATDGRFTVGGPGSSLLPAGDYYLAAVTDVTKDEQYDPAFLTSIIPAAIRVTLKSGEKSIQDLRVR